MTKQDDEQQEQTPEEIEAAQEQEQERASKSAAKDKKEAEGEKKVAAALIEEFDPKSFSESMKEEFDFNPQRTVQAIIDNIERREESFEDQDDLESKVAESGEDLSHLFIEAIDRLTDNTDSDTLDSRRLRRLVGLAHRLYPDVDLSPHVEKVLSAWRGMPEELSEKGRGRMRSPDVSQKDAAIDFAASAVFYWGVGVSLDDPSVRESVKGELKSTLDNRVGHANNKGMANLSGCLERTRDPDAIGDVLTDVVKHMANVDKL